MPFDWRPKDDKLHNGQTVVDEAEMHIAWNEWPQWKIETSPSKCEPVLLLVLLMFSALSLESIWAFGNELWVSETFMFDEEMYRLELSNLRFSSSGLEQYWQKFVNDENDFDEILLYVLVWK